MASSGGGETRLMVRIARTLYRRWERLDRGDRERLEPLARSVKESALDLRGQADMAGAEQELAAANKRLAEGIAAALRADPEFDTAEIDLLREDLRRELGRTDPDARAA